MCWNWNRAAAVEPAVWSYVSQLFSSRYRSSLPPLLWCVAAVSNTLKSFFWKVFVSRQVKTSACSCGTCDCASFVCRTWTSLCSLLPVSLSLPFSLLTSGLFLPWAINPASVPLPWFYSLFHACSALFGCSSKQSVDTEKVWIFNVFVYLSRIFVRHKHEDSRHDTFSFCFAEFPQFVDVPIPVHLHIIPGNRVRLPFTPLPRHQWSHASESKSTLSNLCFSLLIKSFSHFCG